MREDLAPPRLVFKNAVQVVNSRVLSAPAPGAQESSPGSQLEVDLIPWNPGLPSSFLPTSFLPFFFASPHHPLPPFFFFCLPQISSSGKQRPRALHTSELHASAVRASSLPGDPGSPGLCIPSPTSPASRSLALSLLARWLPHHRSAGRKAAGAQDGFNPALRPASLLLGAGGGASHGGGRRGCIQGAGV